VADCPPSTPMRRSVPTRDLRRRLSDLTACYAWMVRDFPEMMWERPRSAFEMQRELTDFLAHVEKLRAHCDDVIVHADLLWTMAGEDAKADVASAA
jgi:hypothetical protein